LFTGDWSREATVRGTIDERPRLKVTSHMTKL